MDKEELEKELKRQEEQRKISNWGAAFNKYYKIKRNFAKRILEDC